MDATSRFTDFTGFTRLDDPAGSESQPRTVPHRPFYTPQELYEYYEGTIGLHSIYRMLKNGTIKHIKPGTRNMLIPASELTAWQTRAQNQSN